MIYFFYRGVVTVDVKLDELDIQQCSQSYHVPNAFKNTARCHASTYVSIRYVFVIVRFCLFAHFHFQCYIHAQFTLKELQLLIQNKFPRGCSNFVKYNVSVKRLSGTI